METEMTMQLFQPLAVATIIAFYSGFAAQAATRSFPSAAALGAHDLADSTSGCPSPRLTVEPVRLSSAIEGAILHFASSEPACMGAQGEYQSLAVRGDDGEWRTALEANPQLIKVGRASEGGAAPLSVYSVAGCTGTYTWTGRHYAERRQTMGGICGNGPFPAGLHLIEQAVVRQEASRDGAPSAQTEPEPDPVRTVRTVVGQVDRLPCWCAARFGSAVAGYATTDLIRAVEHGSRVARAKQIDLWDADLFTGQQNVKKARLLSGRLIAQSDVYATVAARIDIDYVDGSVYPPVDLTYSLKKVGGRWLIDDFRMARTPSVKRVFLYPKAA